MTDYQIVETITLQDLDNKDMSMTVEVGSDGGIEVMIEDKDDYDYASGQLGSMHGISLTAEQVSQLREVLS